MTPSAPIWADAAAPSYTRWPGANVKADVAVVGGGLTGLSAAYHLLLRRPGARVVVLEAERLGFGASSRNTGMLGPGVGQSVITLVQRRGHAEARALYRATLGAVGDAARLIEREGIDCDLAMTGQLVVARSRASRVRLARQADLLESFEVPVERLEDGALQAALRLGARAGGEPADGPAALRLPVAGTLHPGRLVAGLAERVARRGGILYEGARVRHIGTGRPARLELSGGGDVIADDVVIATAGYSPGLGLFRGRILPVHLQVLVSKPLTPAARAILGWQRREGVLDARRVFSYFRLTRDDRIVFGGGAPRYLWAGRLDDSGRGADNALRRLANELSRTFPADARVEVESGWTGVIGYVADALPAIERLRGHPAVVHVVGWCGHGVALSLASGAWVTHILCEGAVPEDLPWFRDRLPWIPFEPVRWLSFRAAVGTMELMDQLS
jgi:gamma-glutamylputrescine oxidase